MNKLAVNLLLIFLLLSAVACSRQNVECCDAVENVVFVRIPPVADPTLTPGQNWYRFSEFLYPSKPGQVVDPTEYKGGVPNYDGLLTVELTDDHRILLGSSPQSNARTLQETLAEIFRQRTENHVFVEGSNETVKAVGIRIPTSAKFADMMEIATSVRDGGAEPIVLLIDGHLPYRMFTRVSN